LPPPSISIFIRINQRRQQRRQRIVVVCQLDSSGSAVGSAAAATPAEASDERTRPAAAAEFIRLWTFIRIRFWTFIRVTTDSGWKTRRTHIAKRVFRQNKIEILEYLVWYELRTQIFPGAVAIIISSQKGKY